jgi:hypothetical protein
VKHAFEDIHNYRQWKFLIRFHQFPTSIQHSGGKPPPVARQQSARSDRQEEQQHVS